MAPRIGTPERPLRVAIIGSGPAGFFAADALLKHEEHVVEVDVFERLPTPYGLVRSGVAPDHQRVKSVTRVYERAAGHERFRFYGNAEYGRDLRLADLRARYDQVLFATGNEGDRRLGIPGEGAWRAVPSGVLVGWYNGHPDFKDAPIDLSVERVAVIGNGNVAVDVARILAKTPEELARTDIAGHALERLERSRVREITLYGRRGPAQAAFTPVELRELGELEAANIDVDPAELPDADPEDADAATRRNLELLRAFAARPRDPSRPRTIRLRFLRSPVRILSDERGRVCGLELQRNELVRDETGRVRPRPTGEVETVEVEMVVSAIGFVGTPLPGVPFDEERKRIRNVEGRIVEADGTVVPGLYVAGWARTGAQGLLGAHKKASAEVVARMIEDLAAGRVPDRPLPPREAVEELLRQRGVDVVTFDDWRVLDEIERQRGARRGAPRDKLTDVDEMLATVREG